MPPSSSFKTPAPAVRSRRRARTDDDGDENNAKHALSSSPASPPARKKPTSASLRVAPSPPSPLPTPAACRLPRRRCPPSPLLPLRARPSVPGPVYVFGNGDAGQLGLGEDVKDALRPRAIRSLDNIVDIAVGGMHSLALADDGTIYSWGNNDEGALGRSVDDGDECDVGEIPNSPDFKFTKMAAGDSISLAIGLMGELYAWGTFRGELTTSLGFSPDVPRQLTPTRLFLGAALPLHTRSSSSRSTPDPNATDNAPPSPTDAVVDIAAGDNHALALTRSGVVYAWGSSEQRQVGFRTTRWPRAALKPRALRFGTRRPPRTIQAIACGSFHSLTIDNEGDVWAFGLNNFGQCGCAFPTEITTPVKINLDSLIEEFDRDASNSISNKNMADKDASLSTATTASTDASKPTTDDLKKKTIASSLEKDIHPDAAVASRLSTKPASKDVSGVIITVTTSDVKVSAPALAATPNSPRDSLTGEEKRIRAVAAAAGEHHSLVLLSDGRVLAFGKSDGGELGLGYVRLDEDGNPTNEPEYYDAPVVQQRKSSQSGAASDGDSPPLTMRVKVTKSSIPYPQINPHLKNIKQIFCGTHSNIAIDSNGDAFYWGSNIQGQLGDGSTEDVMVPKKYDFSRSGAKVTRAGCGAQHSVLLVRKPQQE